MTGDDDAPATFGRRLRGLARRLRPAPEAEQRRREPDLPAAPWGAVVLVGPRQARHLSECLTSLHAAAPHDVVVVPWAEGAVPDRFEGPAGLRWRALPRADSAGQARTSGLSALGQTAYVVFVDAAVTIDPATLRGRIDALETDPHATAAGPDAASRAAAELAPDADPRAEVPDLRPGEWVFRFDAELAGSLAEPSAQQPAQPPARAPEQAPDHAPRSRFGWQLPAGQFSSARHTPGLMQRNAERIWGTPFGTVPSTAPELDGYVHDLADLAEVAGPAALAAALAYTASAFLDDSEHADPAALAAWGDLMRTWLPRLDAGGPPVKLAIPTADRIRLWLLAEGRVAEMQQLTVDRWFQRPDVPTRLIDGRIVGDFGVVGLPDPIAELPPRATRHLLGCQAGERRLVRVVAAIDWLDDREQPVTHAAFLVSADGQGAVEVPVAVREDPAATRFVGRTWQRHDSDLVEIDLTDVPFGRWRLEIESRAGDLVVRGPLTGREVRGGAGDLDRLPGWSWNPESGLEIVRGKMRAPEPLDQSGLAVTGLQVDDSIVLTGIGKLDHIDGLALRLGDHVIPALGSSVNGDQWTAEFLGTFDPWGLGARALPSGTWRVTHRVGRRDVEVGVAPELLDRLPLDLAPNDPAAKDPAPDAPDLEQGPLWRARVLRGLRGQVLVRLTAPLTDAELGPWAQQQLRTAYAQSTAPIDPDLALFSSYAGTGATDSPRAICEELQRRQPGMTIRWAVADRSVLAPPGTIPVLVRSAEWYDVLARAAVVVTNVELDRFYRPREGQRVLQTFHGYPSKAMGIGLWESKNFSPRRLERQLDNTARTWTWALTPTPAMDHYYRDNYRYDGEILHGGYPRDDALTGSEAGVWRTTARARLGIADDRIAVLVAPTWRDDLATNFRSAADSGHLDVERLAEILGRGYVVLSRGHRFHDAAGSRGTVIDVGAYPEVNDLILAADAAVLDYSSMRFDLALAGVPMVFCVPDLEAYAGQARGFLFPFTDSAPGPLVDTTQQVAAELVDLDRLRAEWAPALTAFNATYNDRQDGHAAARVVDALLGDVGFAG